MGLINWFKEKRLDEMSFDIKKLKQEMEFLETAQDNLKTQVNSLRTKVYRGKKQQQEEEEEEGEEIMDVNQIQRNLLGLR